ncbi:2-pyrone-4,6-dicarboxylate hydrolase [Caballeronia pedi]|uniref:2-pyrone-4,6-dicarboxylate hydrolase n=1 Tax=Caballeronia pedi TaxID=1777141 RepID=A0A158EAL5_9BURK|nr:amidohydrolase family protein [Caballeronia pedi]SAL02947.1 2-pyrone-4,6-dicarboxylate hydrolase [Caballeronia pedi]
MFSRRKFLISTGAALGTVPFFHSADAFSKSLDHISPLTFRVPDGTTDCHCHIFDPEHFPYSPKRRYTPPPATVNDLRQFHKAIGVQRTVLVQPSVYGTDNSCLLDALKQLGQASRGIAVINKSFSAQQIDDLLGAGVRGVRINLEVGKDRNSEEAYRRLMETVETLRGRQAVVQVFAALEVISSLAPQIQAQPHQVVLDHFGFAKAAKGPEQEGFTALTGLMASGKVFVKLSAPYRISKVKPGYPDSKRIGKALVDAAPNQVVWATDWPHTGTTERPAEAKLTDIEEFRVEDDGQNFSLVKDWAGSKLDRQKLLVDNPSQLFGFRAVRT